MRRSPLTFVAVALILGLAVAGAFYYSYRKSPRFALQQMATALIQRNYDKFYSYVDMGSILSSLMQETGKELITPDIIPKSSILGELGAKMGSKFLQQLVPQVFETFQKEVFQKLINKYLDTLTTQELLALQAAVTMAQITQDGEMAQVTLTFPQEEGSLHLTMVRDPKTGRWRITSVSYEDLKGLIKRSLSSSS